MISFVWEKFGQNMVWGLCSMFAKRLSSMSAASWDVVWYGRPCTSRA